MLKVALRGVLARKFRLALTGTARTSSAFPSRSVASPSFAFVSLVAGAVAAVIPAWRASRLQVFEAIGRE